ncbi:MAG: efflux transporter outer membrane subunit [Planctomycetes bacterium]|nr:efflux transporter outer membrane subunit [Planctomycetota bacterium]MBI3835581.1 efflux transporter outer membrane subunit [Planctomycetota bacterium]
MNYCPLRIRVALGVSVLTFLTVIEGGCKVGPNYKEPQAPVAPEWTDPGSAKLQRGEQVVTHWWEVLNDPALNNLVETAYQQNPSLQAAGVRVLEAQARRAVAFGLLFPQQQEAFGNYTWNQVSNHSAGPVTDPTRAQGAVGSLSNPVGPLANAVVGQPGIDNVFQNWQMGFGASWELDVWGRYRRGIEAADAQILAKLANYDDVLVSLIAEVATNYVLLRSLEEQLAVTRNNVAIQQRGFELADTKFKGGTTTGLDPAQAAALLHDTEAQALDLETKISQTKSTLCVLLGLPPQDLTGRLAGANAIPSVPESIAIGIPAELLRRRPDVRRVERQLAAQSAVIGVAVADLYPSFSLSGNLGVEAEHFNDLWHGDSLQAFAGPSFRWAILNYGRIRNIVRVQDAAFQALISDYESVVLRAQGEVESAVAGFLGAQRQVVALTQSVDAATQAVSLAEQQYRGGIADYTRVLTTQESLTQEQSRLVSTRGAVALNLVSMYRALGGGWELRESHDLVPADIKEQMKERTRWGKMIDADRMTEPSSH